MQIPGVRVFAVQMCAAPPVAVVFLQGDRARECIDKECIVTQLREGEIAAGFQRIAETSNLSRKFAGSSQGIGGDEPEPLQFAHLAHVHVKTQCTRGSTIETTTEMKIAERAAHIQGIDDDFLSIKFSTSPERVNGHACHSGGCERKL